MIMRVSLAYCIIGKFVPDPVGSGKLRWPKSLALLIKFCSRSATRTNNKGESGSPCLTPLLQWNIFHGTPFKRTDEVPDWNIISIHCNHFDPKPLCFITCNISLCSTLSKAFPKSSLRMTNYLLDLRQR